MGEDSTCDDVACDDVLGACCADPDICYDAFTQPLCTLVEGSYAGDGTRCSDAPCSD